MLSLAFAARAGKRSVRRQFGFTAFSRGILCRTSKISAPTDGLLGVMEVEFAVILPPAAVLSLTQRISAACAEGIARKTE